MGHMSPDTEATLYTYGVFALCIIGFLYAAPLVLIAQCARWTKLTQAKLDETNRLLLAALSERKAQLVIDENETKRKQDEQAKWTLHIGG